MSHIGGRPRQLEFAREERISKRESLGDMQRVYFPRQVQKRNEHVCTHRQTSTQMFRFLPNSYRLETIKRQTHNKWYILSVEHYLAVTQAQL